MLSFGPVPILPPSYKSQPQLVCAYHLISKMPHDVTYTLTKTVDAATFGMIQHAKPRLSGWKLHELYVLHPIPRVIY